MHPKKKFVPFVTMTYGIYYYIYFDICKKNNEHYYKFI